MKKAPIIALLCCVTTAASAAEPDPGELRIPFASFRALEERLRALEAATRQAPVDVAVGRASVTVDRDGLVEANVELQILTDGWANVPLLPAGTAIESATVDGGPLALTPRGADLVWSVRGAGSHHVVLRYRAVRHPAPQGGSLDLPLPPAAALTLTAQIPGADQRVDLVPGEILTAQTAGDTTSITAQIPRTTWARLAWRPATMSQVLATSAEYVGRPGSVGPNDDLTTIRWQATLGIELLGGDLGNPAGGATNVPVAKRDVAIVEARVDGKPAVLLVQGDLMVAQVAGRGTHVITLVFDTKVTSDDGPTGTALWTPSAPVSSVRLELPGDKDVVVTPAAGMARSTNGAGASRATVVAFNLPPTADLDVRWSEALPAAASELRVNAELFHVVRADEGVLSVTTSVVLEVARGKAQRFVLGVPADTVVNTVKGDGISDWRLGDPGKDGLRPLTVYLDRDLVGTTTWTIDCERLVPQKGAPLAVPLMVAQDVHRQRGMVVLVRGRELEVVPDKPVGLSEVGENQIPGNLRDPLGQTVTHTYKYVEADQSSPAPALTVRLTPFERELARLHASINTLFSLGEGVLRAAAAIEVKVKAGTFAELTLVLPNGINVLAATAPSLREHRVVEPAAGSNDPRLLQLSFTREMEGVVQIDLAWEHVLAPGDAKLAVPLVHVRGAVVEEGKLAIEALTAVEVKPEDVQRLLPLDIEELPQNLVLRTTNPILLAYHYVHADPPAALTLSVKRHAEIAVQVAAIDRADYQTLWTRDGVVLTRARYAVRNRGKQFLRVALPAGAVVWSAELAGQPVKPARDEGDVVLVPLLNAAEPFVVELVFATQAAALGFAGTIEGQLPSPDLVETATTWEVYLPDDVSWGSLTTNMTVSAAPDAANAVPPEVKTELAAQSAGLEKGTQPGRAPLRINVPAHGRHMVLTKLLANVGAPAAGGAAASAGGTARFRLAYSAPGAGATGAALVFFGALALGLLLLRLTAKNLRTSGAVLAGVGGAGVGALLAGGVLAGAWIWVLPAGGVVVLMAAWRALAQRRARLRGEDAGASSAA